jgi:amino acid adenylation domain-containing protein
MSSADRARGPRASEAPSQPRHSQGAGETCEGNVARLFQKQAASTPDANALAFGAERWTYAELEARANRLAHRLRELGVGPGSLVGISVERSLRGPLGILGILKAGGAYVALDPRYPRERLEFMLEDSGAPIVLTDAASSGGISDSVRRVLLDSPEMDASSAACDDPVDAGAGPEDLAYVIYTSGSTGRPKGVSMPHRALWNLVSWQVATARQPAAKTLQFASLNFDVSFQEMFSTWAGGGTLVLVEEEVRRDAAELWRRIESEAIERLFLPFIALQHLAEAADRDAIEAPALSDVITAGEQLQITPAIARLFERRGRMLENQYGPSETHVATAFRLSGPPRQWPALPPIGRPIANLHVHILGEDGRPVPDGEPGEIYIGGAGVARGYWNRPDLTATKFVPDVFAAEPGARLYRTGDLAKIREGEIEFLGRLDHQVKIRGYRVEPGEVSSVLALHPGVRECVVVARADGDGSKSLAAYLVARDARAPRVDELRAFLNDKLPEYMVPSAFVVLEKLPLTPSGKVDTLALPPPGPSRPDLARPFVAPRDPVETRLAEMWARALRVDSIGVHDDFFELGGHSIIAGRLFAEIQKAFGRRWAPTILLEAPTVEKMAILLREGQTGSRWTSLVPIQAGGTRPPLFCLHAGAGTVLYYYDLARELGPDQPVYGLQAQGLYGDMPPHGEVAEMAAHYAREIRTVQPEGPYFLTGFCFGGLLAFAVARELVRSGSTIGLLASFDGGSHLFDYGIETGDDEEPAASQGSARAVRSWTSRHWSGIRRLSGRERLSYLTRKAGRRWRIWRNRLRNRFYTPVGDALRRMGRPLPEFLRHSYFRETSVRASARYHAEPLSGKMVLFVSQGLWRDPTMGWNGLLRDGLDVREVPVRSPSADRYHASFIRAVAEPFGKVLRSAMAEEGVRARGSG